MTLTKADLTEQLTVSIGLNRVEAPRMVEAFFEEISSALASGNEVKISGFGIFSLRQKPERPGRNPKTGELIPITARRVVTFSASPKLKCAVSGFKKTSSRLEVATGELEAKNKPSSEVVVEPFNATHCLAALG